MGLDGRRKGRLLGAALLALLGSSAVAVLGATPLAAKPAKRMKVDIAFTAQAGKDRVACGKPIENLGSTRETAQLEDLRFYVSRVSLIRKDGVAVPVRLGRDSAFRVSDRAGSVTLIDLENRKGSCSVDGTAATNSRVRGTVPKGRYAGVRWTVGVPNAMSHTDVAAAPAPLNLLALAWDWQYGRKFMKIEVTDPAGPGGTWPSNTFFVHIGSVGCVGNPAVGQKVKCSTPNRAEVRLPRFNPAKQKVAVDVRALLKGNNITTNEAGAPGCMSEQTDPECGGVFRALGIDWHPDGTGTGRSPHGKQTVFRAISR